MQFEAMKMVGMSTSRIGIRGIGGLYRPMILYKVPLCGKRLLSSVPPPVQPQGSSQGEGQGPESSRNTAAKIASRIPKFLRPYTTDFMHAPISHVTAFIVLHELTAIVPLIGLWYVFHQHHEWIPMDLPTWALDKGMAVIDKGLDKWDFSDYSVTEKAKFIMEGTYAYAITKALFPFRLMFSVSMMPWFARWFVVPITRAFSRVIKRGKSNETKEIASSIDSNLDTVKTKKVHKPRL